MAIIFHIVTAPNTSDASRTLQAARGTWEAFIRYTESSHRTLSRTVARAVSQGYSSGDVVRITVPTTLARMINEAAGLQS